MRDEFVHWACNFLIQHVATKRYAALLSFIYMLGVNEADRQMKELENNA